MKIYTNKNGQLIGELDQEQDNFNVGDGLVFDGDKLIKVYAPDEITLSNYVHALNGLDAYYIGNGEVLLNSEKFLSR